MRRVINKGAFTNIPDIVSTRNYQRGLLLPSLVVSYSHTDADIDRTIDSISEAPGRLRNGLTWGQKISDWLRGQAGLSKLN